MFLPASSAHSGLLVTMLPVSHRLRQVSPQSVIINAIYGRIFVSAFTGVCRRVCCDRSSTPPVNKGHARVRNMLIERRKQFAFVWLVKGSISENKPNKPSSVSPTGFSCVRLSVLCSLTLLCILLFRAANAHEDGCGFATTSSGGLNFLVISYCLTICETAAEIYGTVKTENIRKTFSRKFQ
uniref:Secreted protein n=1 Tax=Heterorhabditis bacteriophora TaxID=37862 RepID=A0A1I7WK84_HETBA